MKIPTHMCKNALDFRGNRFFFGDLAFHLFNEISLYLEAQHMQPIYRTNPFVTVEGNGRGRSNAYIKGSGIDVGADIFRRGLCLPSDNKMTPEQQDRIIEIIHRCFR